MITAIQSRKIRRIEHEANVEPLRNACKILAVYFKNRHQFRDLNAGRIIILKRFLQK
jgi:hypothetical protein